MARSPRATSGPDMFPARMLAGITPFGAPGRRMLRLSATVALADQARAQEELLEELRRMYGLAVFG